MWDIAHIIGCFTTHVCLFPAHVEKVKDHAPLCPGEIHLVYINLHVIRNLSNCWSKVWNNSKHEIAQALPSPQSCIKDFEMCASD